MEHTQRLYWVWLSLRLAPGRNTAFIRLIDKFGTPYEIYRAQEEDFCSVDDVPENIIAALCNKELDSACRIMDECAVRGYGIITYGDSEYPSELRSLVNPPIVLYCEGKLPDMEKVPCLGIVGTRKMSEYGMRCAYKISYELAAAGMVIVSGMAYGIDSVSACAALAANGVTVAILGCGLNTTYPAAHSKLRRAIVKNGAVISEYPPDTKVERYYFPQRNRLISGLCHATLVVEAGENSGALITANNAIMQGRQVFAIPGSVGSENSGGTNRLIHDGANVALDADDIYAEYAPIYPVTLDRMSMVKSKRHSDFDGSVLDRYGVAGADTVVPARRIASSRKTDAPFARSSAAPNEKVTSATESSAAAYDTRQQKDDKTESNSKYAEEILSTLGEIHRKIYSMFEAGKPMMPDNFVSLGESTGDIIAALTALEIVGLIHTMPGGIYIRA